MKKNLIFFGCDRLGGRGLERLAASRKLAKDYQIVGVVTSDYAGANDRLVECMASMLGLPVFTGKINTPEGENWIDSLHPDVAVMMEFDQRVNPEIIRKFELFLNMHPADLPRYRGGAPMQYAIMDGAELTVTVHRVTAEFDAGDYLAKSFPINIAGLNMDAVNQLAAREGAALLEQVLLYTAENKLVFIPQEGTPSLALEKELPARIAIDWTRDCGKAIAAKVLAGNQWWRPECGGRPMAEAWFIPGKPTAAPGTMVTEYGDFVSVAAIDGMLLVRLQPADGEIT